MRIGRDEGADLVAAHLPAGADHHVGDLPSIDQLVQYGGRQAKVIRRGLDRQQRAPVLADLRGNAVTEGALDRDCQGSPPMLP